MNMLVLYGYIPFIFFSKILLQLSLVRLKYIISVCLLLFCLSIHFFSCCKEEKTQTIEAKPVNGKIQGSEQSRGSGAQCRNTSSWVRLSLTACPKGRDLLKQFEQDQAIIHYRPPYVFCLL